MSDDEKPGAVDISADRPGTDPSQDALGYAPFAEKLARSILRLPSDEGMVIAVHGAWGSGKTTFLNYVHWYLRKNPLQSQPICVSFNPWWFSGDETLLRAFFDQLRAHVGGVGDVLSKLGDKFADLADAVSTVPVPHTAFARPLAWVLRAALRKPKDVQGLKQGY
jgi:hypothetical protein